MASMLFSAKALAIQKIDPQKCQNQNNPVQAISSDGEQIQIAAGPTPEDPRKKISDINKDDALEGMWPKASSNALSSVQTFVCGDITASAVLACDGKTIVTNAHNVRNFYRNGQLRWKADDSKECFFAVEKPDKKYVLYEIEIPSDEEARSAMGTMYPLTVGEEGNDWAVLKLKDKVDSKLAKPAMVMSPTNASDLVHRPLVQTAAFNNDFGDQNAPPRIYNLMTAVETKASHNSNFLVTNGHAEPGGSGGGIFPIEDNKPYLSAISFGRFGPGEEANVSGQGSYAIPLNGKFLETLKAKTSNKNCIKELKPREQQQAAL